MLRPSLILASILLVPAAPMAAQTCLSTTFASNNGGSVGGAVYFDVTAVANVLVVSLDMNYSAVAGTAVGVDVYTTPGTSVGNETNFAAWTLVGTDNGAATSAGTNLPTPITLASPVLLNAGSHGVALVARGSAHRYTNGNGANQTYSDAFLTLQLGQASNVPFTAGIFTPRVFNGTICYNPASGLFPNFTATPEAGPLGTVHQFTDTTFTSDPGGVLAWAWDFDNNGTIDSNLQNPTHVYPGEGRFTVTLTATDAMHGSQSITRTDLIAVDLVSASFTASPAGGNSMQFTDTSTGSPTSWAWDFENDGTVDSNAQNPLHTYASAGQYTCRLTVTDAVSNDTTTENIGVGIIPVPGFGSTFSSATLTRGFWFQSPVRFSVVSMSVPDESAHGLQNVALYRLAGAPPPFPGTASGGLEFFQAGTPSGSPIPCAVSFDAGEFVGVIGACGDATTMRSSYGTPAGPFASSVLGQPTTLTRFLTQTNIVTAMGTGAYSEEVAGAVGRVILGVSGCTSLPYGTGSPSGVGPPAPVLTTTSLPFVGSTAVLTVDNQDANAIGFLVVGFGRANTPTPFGTLLVSNIGATLLMNGGAPLNIGPNNHSFPVPNSPIFIGFGPVNWQNGNLLLTGQVATSNGQEWFLDV